MIQRTPEGLLVTPSGVRLASVVFGTLGMIATGAIGAARYMAKIQDAPTRSEFHDHVLADSVTHREQAIHSAFVDSAIARAVQDNHATSCVVAHYPLPLCADVMSPRR